MCLIPSLRLRYALALALWLPVAAGFGDCGRSSPLACSTHQDCPTHERCAPNRQCTPKAAECASDRECGIRYRCENFDCVPLSACRDDFDCSPPKRCHKSDRKASHGRCTEMKECPVACPPAHYCGADLRCIPDGACGSDEDCAGDTQCDHGRCRAMRCKDDRDCIAPRRCESASQSKVCKLPVRCRYDQECPRTQYCKQKTCSPRPNACDACAPGQTCVEGRCL